MKGIGPPRSVISAAIRPDQAFFLELLQGRARIDAPIRISAGSADHGAAAAGFRLADLGVARLQHFGLGKLRFSFAE
ncbi:hypothetical protein GCM10007881_34620 [Mesorhizobium huakuii]|nr:hypothetical protein GCM10007881_34620 [Mesorhizobium huakuii]